MIEGVLGDLMDRRFAWLRRVIRQQLVPAILESPAGARALLISLMARSYYQGRNTGYVVHGAYLGAPRFVPAQTRRAWSEEAIRHGQFVVSRLDEIIDERGEVSARWLGNWGEVSGRQAVWQGQDEEAQVMARLAQVDMKRWTRAWDRLEARDWHDELNGVTIPVEDAFTLPGGPNAGSRVYGPRDWDAVADPEEHINCGHALEFLQQATLRDVVDTLGKGAVVYSPPRA